MQHSPYLREKYEIIQNMFLNRTKLLERCAARCSWLGKIYFKVYHSYVKKEIKMAKIDAKTKVLHIGGGLPYTATIIARLTGAQVAVLEIEPKIKEMAVEWVKKHGLEKKIEIIIADGKEASMAGFDVIILSLSIKSKEAVFANIFKTCDPKTKIIYRSARESLKTVYEDNAVLSKYGHHVKQTVYHSGISIGASHLITKDAAEE